METPFCPGLCPTHWEALGELLPARAGPRAALLSRKFCGELLSGLTSWRAQANPGDRFWQCHWALKTCSVTLKSRSVASPTMCHNCTPPSHPSHSLPTSQSQGELWKAFNTAWPQEALDFANLWTYKFSGLFQLENSA